ncbi:MAG: IPT/TIG domain-containing protein [Chitinophagales bacterium]|nr:IPT/TIG domain-containing protein [Chitinophagales bacterium]
MPQLQNELAERELIKQFRHDNTWLGEVRAKNNWVNNDVIKIPIRGAAPTVLINNTSYPLDPSTRNDDFKTASLHKYDTENTAVTDDELYALPYEKVSDVQEQHRETLEDVTSEHALYALSVAQDSLTTPVLETTGDVVNGRKRLTTADLIKLWEKLGKMNVPKAGRVIVLSTEHAADLMAEDSGRAKAWGADFQTGNFGVMHVGFKLWVANYSPRYAQDANDSNKYKKQAFESLSGKEASVVIFAPNAIKATGSAKRYAVEAAQNPRYRQNEIGFRLWFGAWALKDEGFAAIVSASADVSALPNIGSVSPSAVASEGTVVISGTNFTGATAVKFGATAAASFTVDSNNGITAVLPVLANGNYDVIVITAAGQSNAKSISVS